jgi:MerR family glutamine synthetase transcriptional repressor
VPVEKNGSNSRGLQDISNYTMAITVRLTGVEAHRIRRYEEGGLLKPERTEGNQRLFSESEIEIIKQAAELEDEGINVEGIKAIMAMRKGERN